MNNHGNDFQVYASCHSSGPILICIAAFEDNAQGPACYGLQIACLLEYCIIYLGLSSKSLENGSSLDRSGCRIGFDFFFARAYYGVLPK